MPHIEGAGEELYTQIETMGMEGVVGKRKDSQYVSRRSKDWLKVINWSYANVFITGYKNLSLDGSLLFQIRQARCAR